MAEFLRIGEVATALGVSVDTLRRWETQGRVAFERQNGQRVLSAEALRPLLASHTGGNGSSSARNRFAGIVTNIVRGKVMAQVEMACGDYRVVSLMSSEALDELGIEVGSNATAIIKATNVIVEA